MNTTSIRRPKISLNAYSFNAPLMSGEMSVEDLIDYCAAEGFDAVDITGYYFKGYPEPPSPELLNHIKRRAFLAGLEISGTGVRNDFSVDDPVKRAESVQLVKNWIEVAAQLGAPVIRIFAGTQQPKRYTWIEMAGRMVEDIRDCLVHGRKHGVVVAVQNHDDFLKNAGQVIRLLQMVDSDWFGLILDTGSYRQGDPYAQIAQTIPYAVNWQVKENIYVDGVEQKTDLPRLVKLIRESGYQGYLPIETLGAGDPRIKVRALKAELVAALDAAYG